MIFYNSIIRNCLVSGALDECVFSIGNAHGLGFGYDSATTGGNLILENINAGTIDTGSVDYWRLPPGSWYDPDGADPILFRNCTSLNISTGIYEGQDGGVLFDDLPPSPTTTSTHPVVVTDSNDPAWTGFASNVGKPITTGGGDKRVCARYDSTLPGWRIAG